MEKKNCPYCQKDSYSAYDSPNWVCPYCSKRIIERHDGFPKLRKVVDNTNGEEAHD